MAMALMASPAGDSPNSYKRFPEAVAVYEDCKGSVNMSTFLQDWINWYGEESAVQMCLIAWAEARFDWYAVGDDGDSIGMFQINMPAGHCEKVEGIVGRQLVFPVNDEKGRFLRWDYSQCKEALFDPVVNISVARQLYEAQGWTPWSGRKAYLPSFRADWITI